jgi:hypothetical protein
MEWQRTYGGWAYDSASSIQETNDAGYIIAGYTYSSGAGYDIWILKLDSEGDMKWQRTYGGSNGDFPHFVQQTSDEGYIVSGCTFSFGNGSRDGLIIKLTSTGDIEWQHSYGGSDSDCVHSIQQTSNGGYIAEGFTDSFGAGSKDIWILKLDSTGEISPSYDFMGSSYATITDSFVTHQDTYITPQKTTVTPFDTSVFPQDTEATVTLLCSNQEYTLTISTNPGGTTDPSPGTYSFNSGTEVNVTAIPDSGYEFSEWSRDASGSENPITINVDQDKWIIAIFTSLNEEDESGSWELNCFIATAAYDSPFHSHVEILRNFRDKYLITNKLGRKLVKLYYKYSPPLANIIAKHKTLKIAVRISLFPLVAFGYAMVYFGPIKTFTLGFLFIFSFFLSWFIVKRRKRKGQT